MDILIYKTALRASPSDRMQSRTQSCVCRCSASIPE
uniref:Uncharacterized protein n=1 Tax=Anguilla anguilla TaxID=7936 RepID=A0A0E9PAI8_ANGAN